MQAAIRSNPMCNTVLRLSGACTAVENLPVEDACIPWLPAGWSEDATCAIKNAVALALWVHDPLYRTATPAVQCAMEADETTSLLTGCDAAWRAHGGRARGWVRKHLEEELRGHAEFTWASMRTSRRRAHLLDYICVVKNIRVALWWPDHKSMTVFPVAGGVTNASIIQLNCASKRVLVGPQGHCMPSRDWPTMTSQVKGFTWTPPPTVSNSLTVPQLQDALRAADAPMPMTKGASRAALWTQLQWHRLVTALRA